MKKTKIFESDLKFFMPSAAIEQKIKSKTAKCSWDFGLQHIKTKVNGGSPLSG